MLNTRGKITCACGRTAQCARLERLPGVNGQIRVEDLLVGTTGKAPAGYRYYTAGWCIPDKPGESWDRGWFKDGKRVSSWHPGRRLVDRCSECVRRTPDRGVP